MQIKISQGWPEDMEATARFLDRNWDYDSINTDLLQEKLYEDPYADPQLCFTAVEKGDICGFLYGVRRDIRGVAYGYVKLMAVDASKRRQKIGTQLYQKAEKQLIDKGATCLRWYDVPLNYFMPGIDPRYTAAYCFAQKMGFKKFDESLNMITDLGAMDWNTQKEEKELAKKGVKVRRATPENRKALSELLETEWELWANEVDMAMKDTPPSVHIAFIDNKLRAFSVHNGNNKGTGWFGPMGTHPELRGLGMGNILLKRCLQDMKNQGHTHAIIPWVAPVSFYSHYVKAHINRVFWRMEKQIKTS